MLGAVLARSSKAGGHNSREPALAAALLPFAMPRYQRAAICVLLVAATACAGANPSATSASPAGARPAPCGEVVKPGLPVTERLLAEGCREADGSITMFTPFLCRLQGYTAINYRDEVVAVELELDPEPPRPSAPPDRLYGSWAEAMTAPDADATGCIDPESVPDPVGPS